VRPNKLRQQMIDNKAAARMGGRHYAALQGAKAFKAGVTWTECPYEGSLRGAWLAGWNAAQDRSEDETLRRIP
jgi:ribosome modulation factor